MLEFTCIATVYLRWCRSKTGVLSFEGVIDMSSEDWFRQLPLLVLVNLGAGALGATFNALHKALFKVLPHFAKIFRRVSVQTGKASLAPQEGLPRRATAEEYLSKVMHVRRFLQ